MDEVKDDISNLELYKLIKGMEDNQKKLLLLSEDEVIYIREMISDRRTLSRWANKLKLALGLIVAGLTAYALWPKEIFISLMK